MDHFTRHASLASLVALALAACGSQPPASEEDEAVVATTPEPAATPEQLPDALPAAMVGTWNQYPNACDDPASPLRLEIAPHSLEFYESSAELGRIEAADSTSITASYVFTGEGSTWERRIMLELLDTGELRRRDLGEGAQDTTWDYVKC